LRLEIFDLTMGKVKYDFELDSIGKRRTLFNQENFEDPGL